jgi:hypothetical protein
MNRKDQDEKRMAESRSARDEELEPELREALGNFKSSVTAWSEAMMSRPREVKAPARTNWRLMARWALGCAVFAGTVSGGVYQNYRQVEIARVEAAAAAARAAQQQQRELAAQAAQAQSTQSAEDLMAKVDSDISREVPSALEPLASLMTDDQTKGN